MGWLFKNTFDEVVEYLGTMRILSSDFEKETELESLIADRLSKRFEKVHQQFNIEGYVGAKIDLDIQEKIGIEIKLANQLTKADPIHRLFGQIIYYNKRKYDGSLIVLIVGDKKELETPRLHEIVEFIEESIDAHVIKLSTMRSKS